MLSMHAISLAIFGIAAVCAIIGGMGAGLMVTFLTGVVVWGTSEGLRVVISLRVQICYHCLFRRPFLPILDFLSSL